MRRSGDSAASLTRTVGGMVLAGAHAAITDSSPDSPTPRPHAAQPYGSPSASAAQRSDSQHTQKPLGRQSSEAGQVFGPASDADYDAEMGSLEAPMQRYSSNEWEADSDAPEAAPADDQTPGAVQQPQRPFSFRPDALPTSTSTSNAGVRDNSSIAQSGRRVSANGRLTTGQPATASIFDSSASPPRQSAANPGWPSSGPQIAGEGHTSIAAFRPKSGGAAKAADATAMQTLPMGDKLGLIKGQSSSDLAAGASQAQQDFESAAMLPGLPPRPVQVSACCTL